MEKKELMKLREKVFNDFAHENWKRQREGTLDKYNETYQIIDDVIRLTIKTMEKKDKKK